MVCERYWEHKRFESKPFWQVHFGVVDADSGNILKFTSANRWTDKATATDIYNKVKETGSAIITKVVTKRKVAEYTEKTSNACAPKVQLNYLKQNK